MSCNISHQNMRRTRIIGTIGPASDSEGTLEALVDAGLNIARLNYSHGDLEQKTELIQKLRKVEFKFGRPIGILADLPGPKLRLGSFSKSIKLSKNDIVNLHCGNEKLGSEFKLIEKRSFSPTDGKLTNVPGTFTPFLLEITPGSITLQFTNPFFLLGDFSTFKRTVPSAIKIASPSFKSSDNPP